MTDTPRLAALKAKLAARQGRPEFKENCRQIENEIMRLEMAQASQTASKPEISTASPQPVRGAE